MIPKPIWLGKRIHIYSPEPMPCASCSRKTDYDFFPLSIDGNQTSKLSIAKVGNVDWTYDGVSYYFAVAVLVHYDTSDRGTGCITLV